MKKWIVLFVLLFTSFPLFAMDYLQIHKSGTGGSGSSAIPDLTGFTAIGDSIYGAAGNTSSIMAAGANYSIRYPLSSEATGWANLSPVANAIIGWTSGGVLAALTSHMHADDAEQFYNATDDTKTLKLLLSGNTTGANSTLSFTDTTNSTHSVPPGTNTLAVVKTEKLAVFNIPGTADDGTVVDSYIPVDATITGWIISTTGAACSAVVDIWVQPYADFPPEDAQSIAASALPTLSTAQMNKDTTLTGWTTAIAADSFIRANLDSSDCAGNIQVTIIGTK